MHCQLFCSNRATPTASWPGHPWIYAGSVLRLTAPAADGALVQIKDHRQRFLGVGFYNSKSKILVRVLDPGRVEVNVAFFTERIRAALALRGSICRAPPPFASSTPRAIF